MRFELTESQRLLQKSARDFLTAEAPMAEVRRIAATPTAHDLKLWRRMADQGWTGILIPEELGGMGLGMVELAVLFEQMGRVLLPGPFHSTVAWAAPLLQAAGVGDAVLRAIAAGESCATAAVASGGKAMFVADAAAAHQLAVIEGDALYLIPRGALQLTPLKAYDTTRPLYAVEWSGADEPVAQGAAVHQALERAGQVAALALTAEMVGGMQRVLELTVEYAKTRKQFDQPIGKFQAVQHMCADMFLWTESARAAVYFAAYALEQGLPEAASAVSVAKVYAGDAYRECGNRGIQVHGGMGFTWENDMHLYYRRAKASENAFGDGRYHREQIARFVIDAA